VKENWASEKGTSQAVKSLKKKDNFSIRICEYVLQTTCIPVLLNVFNPVKKMRQV